jgi:hypothetical protein
LVRESRFSTIWGGQKKSDFQVEVSWEDVEKIIHRFCEVGQPDALALQEAMRLAAAIKELGWQPPETTPAQSS